jgi:hypothetical protein
MPMMESEYSLTRPQVSTEPDTSPKLFSPRLNLGQLATNHQHFYLRSICSTALIAVADLIAVAEPSSITPSRNQVPSRIAEPSSITHLWGKQSSTLAHKSI